MRLGTVGRQFGVLVLAAGLAACGGGGFGTSSPSGSSGTTTGGSSGAGTTAGGAPAAPANLILTSGTPSVSGATVTATVTDSGSVAIGNQAVTFRASCSNSCVVTPSGSTTGTDGSLSATLTAQSAGNITVTVTAGSLSKSLTLTIPASPNYQLGVLDPTTGKFTQSIIALGQASIPAGGSSGLQVTVYDPNNMTAYSGSATLSFTSNCISAGTATAPAVTNSIGTFNSTYTAKGCSGSDAITATVILAGGSTLTATNTVTVQAATLGSVIFDSTDTKTTTIALKGTGLETTADVYFQVLDQSGNPVSGATVTFNLTTKAGNLFVSPMFQKSGSDGKVHTTVTAGTVHTVVRVIASTTSNGNTLTTQSSLLTVSTGFPTQNGFSISASKLDIEGNDIDGATTTITARLSDRYNNPVPDGTAVSFQAECGNVQPQCTTAGGTCSVTFTSQSPRTADLVRNNMASSFDWYQRLKNSSAAPKCSSSDPHELGCNDHRCTVLATAIGEESFTDCNGSGLYTSAFSSQCPQGDDFVSLPETFQDNNENSVRDSTETYVDFNNNGHFDLATGKFIGLLCADPNCDTSQSSLNVYKSIIIVMSSSSADINQLSGGSGGKITIGVTDSGEQVMPVGTTITAKYNNATGVSPQNNSFTVANTDVCPNTVTGCAGSTVNTQFTFNYSITAPAPSGSVTFYVTTPGANGAAGVTTVSPLIPIK